MLKLERTRAAIERGMRERVHVGAQLALRRGNGELVGELALGDAAPGVALSPDTIMLWMSAVKPLMSVAIGQLVERGRVALDDPVARHIPEFAANGKAEISLRHLLTHTACIPNAHRQWSEETWEEILAKICVAAPEPGWAIGRDCAYHVASAWYVLGEIVRRRDGRPYSVYVREAILGPLGLSDLWVGMPAETWAKERARIAHPHDSTSGAAVPIEFWAWSGSQRGLELCRPGGSGWGTARDLAGFYAALLGGRALRAERVRALTARQLEGAHDRIFGVRLDRALGFVLDSRAYGPNSEWYGSRGSGRAFGHGGYYSSVAFADPGLDLAVALSWNGVATPAVHEPRVRDTLDALYEDVGC